MPNPEESPAADLDEYGGLQLLSIKWALVASAASLLCYWSLASAGLKSKGILLAIAVGSIIFTGKTYWNFRKTSWFWPCMGAAVLVHLAVVALVDVPKPAFPVLVLIFPLMILDFWTMLAAFWVVKSRF